MREAGKRKNRGFRGRGFREWREARLLLGLGGLLGGSLLGGFLFALQVGEATLLFDTLVVLLAHGKLVG